MYVMNRQQTVRQFLQSEVRRLLDPTKNIPAVRVKTALRLSANFESDRAFIFILSDNPYN